MSLAAVSLEELLADFDATAAKWKEFFMANPAATEVPTDIAKVGTVGGLAWHLYMASVVHSQRLLGEPVSNYVATTRVKDITGAWEMHALGSGNLHRFLDQADDAALDEIMQYGSKVAGVIAVTRRKLCMHIFVHAIRHWAQIDPLVRQSGFPVSFPQDILFSEAIR
ncbi:MAG TPA: DinB family protein [Silvibacterium sp.]|nr:DinB family protein [Silvibacterium sp.]